VRVRARCSGARAGRGGGARRPPVAAARCVAACGQGRRRAECGSSSGGDAPAGSRGSDGRVRASARRPTARRRAEAHRLSCQAMSGVRCSQYRALGQTATAGGELEPCRHTIGARMRTRHASCTAAAIHAAGAPPVLRPLPTTAAQRATLRYISAFPSVDCARDL
jgi:hypothetical protein